MTQHRNRTSVLGWMLLVRGWARVVVVTAPWHLDGGEGDEPQS